MLKYLLDNNIANYVIKRRPVEALAQFNRHAGRLALSAISQKELIHGVKKARCPNATCVLRKISAPV